MSITRCFCSIAFRDESIEEIIPKLAKIGYDGVEVWGNHVEGKNAEELANIKAIAEEQNVSIEVLSPYFWFTNSQELHDESLERAKRFTEYCHALGCKKIRTFTDAGPTGIGSHMATEEHWTIAINALQTICDYDTNILFVEELHALTLADTLESTQRLLKEVQRDNFKINYHTPGWDLINDFDILREHIYHIHLGTKSKEEGVKPFIEDGVTDLPAFFKHIQDSGYEHSASIEYCFKGATWDRAQSAFDYLEQHLPK